MKNVAALAITLFLASISVANAQDNRACVMVMPQAAMLEDDGSLSVGTIDNTDGSKSYSKVAEGDCEYRPAIVMMKQACTQFLNTTGESNESSDDAAYCEKQLQEENLQKSKLEARVKRLMRERSRLRSLVQKLKRR